MAEKEAARNCCSSSRAMVSTKRPDTDIVPNGWTREQCRAIVVAMAIMWGLMTVLAVVL